MKANCIAVLAALVLAARAFNTEKRQTTGQACIKQDIVYMLDSSKNIGIENFLQQLEFVKNNIKLYNINPSCTRVGIVTYSQGVYNKFYLNGYTTQQQLLNAIGNIVYTPGTTSNTAGAINYVTNTAFTTQHGARSGVPHYGILVTGSTSSSPTLTVSAANHARQNGVTLYTVGVGQGINQGELTGVAKDPKHQFTARNFNSLGGLAQPVATSVNGAVTPASSGSLGTPSSCLQQADIVFLVDGSGSIGSANFVKLENFVKGIVGKLDVGANKVHVGLMQFSNYPSKQFPLNMYTSRQDVMTGVQNMRYMGGGTNTADAIKYMRQNMFSKSAGARPNVPRIGVVITDGRSANPPQTQIEANNARSDHISMMAIGVGSGVDVNELHNIADDPDSANTFQVSNYDQLDGIVSSIVSRACQVRTTASPSSLSGSSSSSQGSGSILNDTCQDHLPDCSSYDRSVCYGTYEPWSKDNCARYCGHCHAHYTTAPPPCTDALSNCASYQADSCVGAYKTWAQANCRKYCGYCDASSQSVGFYGTCYYKGKKHSQGEKWDDGCDYECICENGQTGKYQCYNKCPVYYNLPSACTLVKKDTECCLQPVCNFQPTMSSFVATHTGKTLDGTDVCVYKGHQYYQGQSWEDGCQYTCTCQNAKIGTYKCQDSCATYSSIPSYCHMIKKPGECCSKPVCEFKTQQGSFTGMGTISGHGVGLSPTAPPPCADVRTDCDMYETGFCDNFKPWARDNCRKTCNLCVENAPNPGPTDVCMYDGTAFSQGQSWKVGCDTECTCENAVYGYYRCVNSCPKYTNIPSGCSEVKKAGDCCTTVQCGSGTFLSSTSNLGSIGNGGLINVGNGGVRPTIPTGGLAPPGTGGTIFQAPTLSGCLYKGVVHSQGEIWQDGCEYICECQNATTGLYSCSPKCPLFPSLPSECKLESNPNDPCCQRPECQFTGTPVPVPPVYRPSVSGHNIVEPPPSSQLYHGTQTFVHQFTIAEGNPTQPSVNPVTAAGYCTYKGKQYNQGQRWDDGCQYNCACENGATGFYRCIEKCPKWTSLPPQCHLEQDKNNTCCQVPVCVFPTVTAAITNSWTGTGPHIITTPAPTAPPTTMRLNACTYKGHYYNQGQLWFDSCDFKCSCDDASVGYYRCMHRCPQYFNVPVGCPYVPDPNDPTCCKVPQCTPTLAPGVSPGTNTGLIPTIPPGTFVGQSNATGYVGYCEYKGSRYNQGYSWSDGCAYTCVCEDEGKGLYRCRDKCPSYTALPPECRLIPDFSNPCCMKPDCHFTASTGTISGGLTPTPPSGSPTPAPKPDVCVYKTAQYSQGQQWTDGCQYKCRCDDASRGLYVCNDRCPKYQTPLPSQCKMETDPLDSCCLQPTCTFVPSPGQSSGTIAPSMLPTKVPGIISGHANTPAPTPLPDGSYPSPQPLKFCEYKGSQYTQDQTWDDGCEYSCRCMNAGQGYYECSEKCPQYVNVPEQCRLTKDAANPCCTKPVCDFPITVEQLTGQNPTPAPSPVPGQSTIAPNLNPTPQPTPGLPSNVCVYRSDKYTQGQQWFDGCNFKCSCEEAERGIYRCSERCAKYGTLPAGCTLVADPADPLCCEIPQCTPPTNSSIPFPTAPLGHVTGGSVTPAPTLKPGLTPTPAPGVSTLAPSLNPSVAPQPKAVCIYKGKQYTQGQRWQDGCDYNCVCQNADAGQYDCTEMCAKYPNLPPQCHLVQDYLKPCCKTPTCNFHVTPGVVTGQHTLTPTPGGPTAAPSPGVNPNPSVGPTLAPNAKKLCSYNGVTFRQGQRWDDGCDLQCVCEDETVGYYRCNQRCAVYPNIPASCSLVTDPSDPCCRIPYCSPTPAPIPGATVAPSPGGPNPTLSPGLIPTVKPVIIGQGVTPTPMPGVSTAQPPIPVCMYNGKKYGQGEKWRDGCQYICECIDAHEGLYKCTERCGVYPRIPTNCHMVADPADSCCKKLECSPTPAPNPHVTPSPQPGVSTLSPPTGSTLKPQPGVSTPAPQPTPAPQSKQVCVMKGVQYTQGQKWNDGCDKMCVCDDGITGHYTCSDRCKVYPSIPSQCTMVPDPADPLCCQVPSCIHVPGTNGVPTPGPTAQPVIYTNAPHAVVTGTGTPPTPTRAPTPAPQPGVSPGTTLAPLPRAEVCVYKGQQYLQDQHWKDGCQYDCICNDGKTGRYTCTERCGIYPNLPQQCTLQRDPNDYCCYVPVCDWNKPTPGVFTPTPQPTPGPGISTLAPPLGSTVAPSPGSNLTPAPKLAFCVYNGVPFKQGQILDDGCTQRCRCDDADTNYYNCYDRCPVYPAPSSSCVMVTDPQDSCCQIPKCNVIPTPAPNSHSTMTPTPGPQNPNVSPGVNPTLAPGVSPTPAPNPYPSPSPIPTAVPGVIISKPDPTRPPQQRGFCQYYGVKYTKGQTWDDACNYECVCLDDMTGQYKCTERCPRYPSIPSYCVMVEDPNDKCCKVPSCPGRIPTPAPNQTPRPVPGFSPTPGSGQPTLSPGLNTLAPPGQSTQVPQPGQSTAVPSPGMPGYSSPNPLATPVPIPTPQPTPVSRDVCIMNGKSYTQGQRWYDGCKQTCVCDDGITGHYTCNQRCPIYNNIQPTCVFVSDPNDPLCCQIPQCTSPNSTVPTPVKGSITGGNNPTPTPRPSVTLAPNPLNPVPTPGPGLTYPPGMIPTQQPTPAPKPGSTNVPNPFGHSTATPGLQPTPAPQPKVCVYKGSQYTQGQTWRDACTYDCNCTDAEHGKYTCTDVCPKYPGLPTYCRMVYDPLNPCCKKPDCSTPAPSPQSTPVPIPGVSTPAPTPGPNPVPKTDFCVYNGIPLKQGQTFADGCDKVCRCEDTMSNKIVCDDRCATFPPLQAGCSMVTDPNDQCCQVPQCQPTNPSTNPNTTIITGVPGTITGSNLPNPNPGSQPVTGTRAACLYGGVQYKTGDHWDDGCTYNCICVDGVTGSYRCTEKCARYTNVPSFCSMVQDPNDACCRKPRCPYIAPTPAPNPNLTPSPQPGVSTLTPQPGVSILTPQPGVSTQAPTPGGQPTPAPNRMICQYKNQLYRQDQVWYDDCNAVCRCESAATGYYRCQERCARYPNGIPSGCTLVPDPKDPSCCKVASCPVVPTAGPTPTPGYLVPNPNTPAPPVITGLAPVPTPGTTYPSPGTLAPGQSTLVPNPMNTAVPSPGGPTQAPTPKTGCFFRGVVYKQNQKFDDGCDYKCECIDDHTGQYKCSQRCAAFPNLPPQCVLVADPKDSCCEVPYCDFKNPTPFPHGIPTPAPHATMAPLPGQPTPKPGPTLAPGVTKAPVPAGYCVYKGVYYTQGQDWKDGCAKKCRCEDVTKGYISCSDRCPSYSNYGSNCVLRTDPNDNCCLIPDCNSYTTPTQGPRPPGTQPSITVNPVVNPGVTGTNPSTPAPIIVYPTSMPGTFTGYSGNYPTGTNTQTGPSGRTSIDACVYKSQLYKQGDKWDDSCSYKCECIDATRAQYKCTERCPHYVNLPPQCIYLQDPNDQCCKIARCDLTPTPQPTPNPPITPSQGPTAVPPITPSPGPTAAPPVTPSQGPTVAPPVTPSQGPTVAPPITPSQGPTVAPPVTPSQGPTVAPPITPSQGPTVAPPITPSQGPTGAPPITPSPQRTANPPITPSQGPTVAPPITPSPQPTANPPITPSQGPTVAPPITPSPQPTANPPITPSQGPTVAPPITPSPQPTANPPITPSPGVYTVNPGFNTGPSGSGQPITINPGFNTGPSGSGHPITINPGFNTGPSGSGQPITINPGFNTGPSGSGHPITINPGFITGHGGSGQPYSPTPFTGIRDQCIYKDMTLHRQGTSWQDGCDYTCFCDDPTVNSYKCNARCQIFSSLPSSCTLVPDPHDNCCKVPQCTGTLTPITGTGGGTSGTGSATLSPSVTNVIPIGTHTSFTGSGRPSVIPGLSSVGSRSVCYYKGTVHQQGQSWDDGCDYTCTCTDALKGMYSCTSKCPNYPALPSYCKKNTVPGLCCPALSCNIPNVGNYNPAPQLVPTPAPTAAPGQNPTPNPNPLQIYPVGGGSMIGGSQYPGGGYALPSGVTYGSIKSQCIYKNKLYNQGDKWDDACDYQCECIDGKSGYFQCKPLCPTYTLPNQGCFMQTLPGQCCSQPVCQGPGGTQINPITNPTSQYPVYGSYSSGISGFRPGYNPSYGSSYSSSWTSSGQSNRCIYHGHIYSQGQTWDDGCDYTCQCTDAQHGQYSCSQKCPTYTSLPPSCHMVTLPGQCCQVVECSQQATSSRATTYAPIAPTLPATGCYDALPNCAAYGQTGCQDPYIPWATQNCRAYCGFCAASVTPTASGLSGLCMDKLSNCQAYGQSACTGIYEPWARDNCKKSCNLCVTTPAPTQTQRPATSSPTVCKDAIANCADYGHSACVGMYQQWASANCQKYCGICSGTGTLSGQGSYNNFTFTNAPTSFYGNTSYCIYKNKIYSQGQRWQDGCDYNCTCEDAKTGFYRCFDLCAKWTNLPAGCTLQKAAGECCSKPVCPGGSTISNSTTFPSNSCYYSGKYYRVGEKWRDGCKYSCECKDGKTGQYQCNELCLKWNSLPSVCHMQAPAPGKCCSKPSCPSNVLLQYPQGYVEPDCPTPCASP